MTAPPDSPWLLNRRQIIAAGLACAAFPLSRAAAAEEVAGDGFRLLQARPGTVRLRGEAPPETAIWGYDGAVPGPTLRVKRGGELKVRLVNELPEQTTVHWHGVRLPNAMDGVPFLVQAPILPGKSFDYRFKPPDAGTFWYHAHFNQAQQMDRGLYGPLIVEETEPVAVDQDIILMFDDWRLKPDGGIDEASFGSALEAAYNGRIGEHLTVNSRPSLDIPVRKGERIRLRLINAANARVIGIRLDKHRARVMAIDGQPAEPFDARDGRVILAPGNRTDIFADMALDAGAEATIFLDTDDASVPIARLVYDKQASVPAKPEEPPPLPANPLPERMDFARALRVDVPLAGGGHEAVLGPNASPPAGAEMTHKSKVIWTMAGKWGTGHDGPPLFKVKRGRTVMLAFANHSKFFHAMHVHGHHFRLLDSLDDGWKPFWLDTMLVAPEQTARIAFVADNPGKWMLHCHRLEHSESGMAAWFEVT
ncbi:MAG: multicopper oxidase family protein [Rhizobiales bacterium]|nr:multicopper oxidase family protein [Hyphomicrobiales bacterium]